MIDFNIFISPDEDAKEFPCFVTTGVTRKDESGISTLSSKLEFIKKSDFKKYEPFSRSKAIIPLIKKIK